jgi:hypothetical protein
VNATGAELGAVGVGRVILNAPWFENPERRVRENAPYLDRFNGSAADNGAAKRISAAEANSDQTSSVPRLGNCRPPQRATHPRDFAPLNRYALPIMRSTFRASLFHLAFASALALPFIAQAEAPFISQLTLPPSGTYNRSIALRFTADFNAPVVVVGVPKLQLNVGGQSRYATAITPLDASVAARIDFEYVPQPFDNAPNGLVVAGAVDPAGGSITGVDGVPAVLSFAAPAADNIRIAALPAPTPQIRSISQPSSAAALVVAGTSDGNSIVTVTRDNGEVVGQVLAAPNGAWKLEYRSGNIAGAHQFSAVAENTEGIPSATSDPVTTSLPGA